MKEVDEMSLIELKGLISLVKEELTKRIDESKQVLDGLTGIAKEERPKKARTPSRKPSPTTEQINHIQSANSFARAKKIGERYGISYESTYYYYKLQPKKPKWKPNPLAKPEETQ